MSAFDFFDRVYCVSLPGSDRWKAMDAQLDQLGIRAKYIGAQQPAPGFTMPNMRRNPRAEFGASLSHVLAIAEAIDDNAERPLFIEDDVVFREGAAERLAQAVTELPKFWEVLYLGGHPREKVAKASANLARVRKFSCAEAYCVQGGALLGLFRHWCNRIGQPDAMFDFILGEFAAMSVAYCVHPVLTDQALVVSHIKGTIDDKRALVERGWANNLC